MKILAPYLIAIVMIPPALAGKFNYMPPKGVVPDGDTAVKIAEAVLIPIYEQDQIDSEKPLIARLDGNVWIVKGSSNSAEPVLGGVGVIEISKRNGQILLINHGM